MSKSVRNRIATNDEHDSIMSSAQALSAYLEHALEGGPTFRLAVVMTMLAMELAPMPPIQVAEVLKKLPCVVAKNMQGFRENGLAKIDTAGSA